MYLIPCSFPEFKCLHHVPSFLWRAILKLAAQMGFHGDSLSQAGWGGCACYLCNSLVVRAVIQGVEGAGSLLSLGWRSSKPHILPPRRVPNPKTIRWAGGRAFSTPPAQTLPTWNTTFSICEAREQRHKREHGPVPWCYSLRLGDPRVLVPTPGAGSEFHILMSKPTERVLGARTRAHDSPLWSQCPMHWATESGFLPLSVFWSFFFMSPCTPYPMNLEFLSS